MKRNLLFAVPFMLLASPALAHVGVHSARDLAGGMLHPLTGLDHVAAMIAVGLWAATRGGRALWLWPLAFVAIMAGGGLLGMAHVTVPLVEPAIVASVLTFGLLLALAIEVPIAIGAIVIAAFALFHGYAHGAEMPESLSGAVFLGGLALTTTLLHLIGIGSGMVLQSVRWQPAIRTAGVACVVLGIGLALNLV